MTKSLVTRLNYILIDKLRSIEKKNCSSDLGGRENVVGKETRPPGAPKHFPTRQIRVQNLDF